MPDEAPPTRDGRTIIVDPDGEPDEGGVSVKTGRSDTGESPDDGLPDELPVLPLRDAVVYPGTVVPLKISREKVQLVLNAAFAGSRLVCAVLQRRGDAENPRLDDLYRVGTACRILKLMRGDDGHEVIVVQGIARIGIVQLQQTSPYPIALINTGPREPELTTELEAMVHSTRENARRAIELSPNVPDEAVALLGQIPTPGGLADFLGANLALPLIQKQELLETFDVRDRLLKVNKAIVKQIEILEISQKIQSDVRGQMDRSQREYYLREQLKAIQQELGIADGVSAEVEKFQKRIAEAKLPQPAEKQARRELDRLRSIPQASPEYSNTVDYLEWMCSLPWSVSTTDRLDLDRAQSILDADHYGLEKVKKRIIEFLAVRKLKPDGRGPILCFAGPPGVGKTSLGQSIARAMDRKFVRISLGGARDEADIRGHRRTYVGALPGRIIQELRKAGANNPVFMLDEVDKLGYDFRGDPASALLEVLDPAQNAAFTDHYLDVPFDLSAVLFIATANYMDALPGPLRDRMEVIELSGYTRREKLEIAKRYLLPRRLEENGLKSSQLTFDDAALRAIVGKYTFEAGVRELERKIGAVCRSHAASFAQGVKRPKRVTERSLNGILGAPLYESEIAAKKSVPGVVTGLAFTPVGGEILFIEAGAMPGQGNLTLTGQIGDVMRESAMAAFSIVRSRASKWGISPDEIAKTDIHIHVPAGAIPKDGPSAGVAMFAALASLLVRAPVDPLTAMTGEITLRGKVLPVGGIRDKVLAAHRAGVKRVILPKRNLRDLVDVPDDVRRQIDFQGIDTIDRLITLLFAKQARALRRAKKKSAQKTARSRTRSGPVQSAAAAALGRGR